MNKSLTLCAFLLLGGALFSQQTPDNFDSYTAGDYLCTQSTNWFPLGSAPGGSADILVSDTDAASVPNSLYFADGSVSQIGYRYGMITDSILVLEFNTKVETNKTMAGILSGDSNGDYDSLSLLISMENGTISIRNGFTYVVGLTSSHPINTWFNFRLEGNLVTQSWELFVDNVSQGSFLAPEVTQIVEMLFYPNLNSGYYIDDFNPAVLEYTTNSIDAAAISVQLYGPTLTGETVSPSVTVRNLGSDVLNSLDIAISYNSQLLIQSFSGLNLATLESTELTITNGTLTCLLGNSEPVFALISNVNGGIDANTNDNSIYILPDIVTAAEGKMVFGEEATGTWCGFCPRGTIGMKHMHENFDSYWAGIAVHNDDPMTVTEYDASMAAVISGYPTALVDRMSGINPMIGLLETDFKERIQIPPVALLENGAIFDSVTRVLTVSSSATFQQAASSNYKMAIILSENHVTGTTSAYDQHNYYSGGQLGEMGGFELLPDPVPAAQMEYNEVARAIKPGFEGAYNCFPATVNSGDVHVVNATFVLPAEWDVSELEIISILIDPSGLVDNAGKATIIEAVSNGFVLGTDIGGDLSVNEQWEPDATFAIYPNPSESNTTVVLQLKEGNNVSLRVVDLSGKEILSRNYGYLNGAATIDMNTQQLPAGTYTIELLLDDKIMQKKFVKF